MKGLASQILAQCARQLPRDWQRPYGYRPLLLETLVDGRPLPGTCYRAANWIVPRETTGRGRTDRYHQADGSPRKPVRVYQAGSRIARFFASDSSVLLASWHTTGGSPGVVSILEAACR